jgi:drug/metabolite transporter (DMT)-like permease
MKQWTRGDQSNQRQQKSSERFYPWWYLVPLYPYSQKPTLRFEVVRDWIWCFEQYQGIFYVVVPIRMTVIRLAIPNMLIWHSMIIIGVKLLSSGRAAILGYTMPAWAVLSGLIFFGDRISRSALLGIALAMSGALLLLSSEFSRLSGQPVGTVMALIAAAGWGFGTVLMKRTQLDMPTISLTFWMLSFTTVIMAMLALIFEYPAIRMPHPIEWAAIIYNSAIIFGFAHVVWFRLARILPPVASSLSVMFIPVLGTFSGAWILGEVPHWQDYVAMLLILGAMSTVLFKPRPVQEN